MSRTILFIAAFWLAVPLWGQSGIMPRRSSSIKIPSQETMEKITEADPELVVGNRYRHYPIRHLGRCCFLR